MQETKPVLFMLSAAIDRTCKADRSAFRAVPGREGRHDLRCSVVLPAVFNPGIAVSEEVWRRLFVWLSFLGAIVVTVKAEHAMPRDKLEPAIDKHGAAISAAVKGLQAELAKLHK